MLIGYLLAEEHMEKKSIILPKPMFFTGETSFPFVFYLPMKSIVRRCHSLKSFTYNLSMRMRMELH